VGALGRRKIRIKCTGLEIEEVKAGNEIVLGAELDRELAVRAAKVDLVACARKKKAEIVGLASRRMDLRTDVCLPENVRCTNAQLSRREFARVKSTIWRQWMSGEHRLTSHWSMLISIFASIRVCRIYMFGFRKAEKTAVRRHMRQSAAEISEPM
jgi:hypothetical protein